MDITPFPSSAIVRLRYTYRFSTQSNATGGLIGAAVTFQPNSCYEPLDTSATQPYGFDQMAALYGKYKVLSAEFQVTSVAGDTGGAALVQILIQSPSGGVTLAGADGGLVCARPNVASYVALASSAPASTFHRALAMHELLGVTKREFDANTEEFAAAVGANPVRMPTISVQNSNFLSASAQSNTVAHFLVLEQTVQFFERIGQALS